ncbi:MAG TPA: hypothetical protein VFH51_07540 [Myxococcota bacterium]|nr:hypothetical protein [Myxococcota bacterium]
MRSHDALAPVACLLCACGAPLTGSTYQGEPLFTVSGSIASLAPTQTTLDRFYIGVAWLGPFIADPEAPVPFAFERAAVADMRFPAIFQLRLLEPPPAEVLWNGQLAVGVIEVLEDTVGDGVLRFSYEALNSAAGPVRGVVPTHWVRYSRDRGFALICGSATVVGQPGCPEVATEAPAGASVTVVSKMEAQPVCWGGAFGGAFDD